jgi:general stress protein CsbA
MFNFIMTILMTIVTTAAIYLGFCLLEPSKENLFFIGVVSVSGYLGAIFYYLTYKEQKKKHC